ncbi:MBL fold metallo-hydrolase [Bacillus sp. H-16]|uniref:YtnP family quorum-quenching lactonase n=1 Tax=Alteribacter salitolerans TaxID=2912333 RepID=UPI0019624FA7|nr:MBL fold metallo-hydrolase [Alteribacter salitolerans]MBM7096386.1 MBL fold metallo-hydrolase [Alteribacter salitolerans]
MEHLEVGNIKITWLNGGVTHMDGGAMFGVVPRPLWEKKYPVNERNQIELRTDPMLIQLDGKNILVEAGIGNGKFNDKQKRNFGIEQESKVKENLKELGLSTEDIHIVLMTHMHFDHACGVSEWAGEDLVSVFPNAVYYVNETEWGELKAPNIRSKATYYKENWEPIVSQVQTYKEEVEPVPGVRLVHTGGHSDGHSILKLESEGERAVHMADIMPTHAHRNPLWVLAYDDYPMDSIGAKQAHIGEAIEGDAWFLFYHDYKYRALKWNEENVVEEAVLRNRENE